MGQQGTPLMLNAKSKKQKVGLESTKATRKAFWVTSSCLQVPQAPSPSSAGMTLPIASVYLLASKHGISLAITA